MRELFIAYCYQAGTATGFGNDVTEPGVVINTIVDVRAMEAVIEKRLEKFQGIYNAKVTIINYKTV